MTEPYQDLAGLQTVGVGHLLTKDELSSGKIRVCGELVDYRKKLTRDQCFDLMHSDVDKIEPDVRRLVTVDLNPYQWDALVLFAYNVGVGAFEHSTLLRKLNDGNYAAVPDELRRWIYSGGRQGRGLVNRREREIQIWNTPIPDGPKTLANPAE